ncbi:MAG: ATP-binding protein [Verrucomicrobia bacterium]|nr:ATP-binding protein [Verrucomicrobiota bacterium]
MHIQRQGLIEEIGSALKRSRSVGLIGPRQCGKSTLAREIAALADTSTFFDLEDPASEARLLDPKLALEGLRGLVVIDEIQRRPDLMPLLRVLLDRDPLPAKFLLLGSASPLLIRNASESLAGRIEFIEMRGFTLDEVGAENQRRAWLRGGFPLSYLAANELDSMKWRQSFLQAFIERDLALLGIDLPPVTVRRFLTMLAHYHGQTWNASELGRSLQLAHTTIKRYLDLMCGALLVRALPPWFENVGKRLVKSPKVYIRDSGLLHALLDLERMDQLESHPKLGASWEGFALEQVLASTGDRNACFWATHAGAELDLCLMSGTRRLGIEFKYTSAPATTKSMHAALTDLKLDHLYLVHPGADRFPLSGNITAIGLADARDELVQPRFGIDA